MTALKYYSTEYSGAVPVNTISGLLEDIEDLPIRYGFIVICSESAAFGFREKFLICVFVISYCYK